MKQVIAPRRSSRNENAKVKAEIMLKPVIEMLKKDGNKTIDEIKSHITNVYVNASYIDYIKAYNSKQRLRLQEDISVVEAKKIKKDISSKKAEITEIVEEILNEKVEIYDETYELIQNIRNNKIILQDNNALAYLKDETVDIYLIVRKIYEIIKKDVIEDIEKEARK